MHSELDIPYLPQGTLPSPISDGDVDEIDASLKAVGLCRWYGKLALDVDVKV